MINKLVDTLAAAVEGVRDGAMIASGGFGGSGVPSALYDAIRDLGVRDLVVVSNNAGIGHNGLAGLIGAGRVRRIICSFPRSHDGSPLFDAAYKAGKIELEIVPQGTLSERLRAAAAGIGGFFTVVSAGTRLGEGKETRIIDGRTHVFEAPLRPDVALVKAHRADRWGNLVYRMAARNFNPVMAQAARMTLVEVDEIVELGGLDPEAIVTPGIFVHRVVCTGGKR